MDALLLDSGDYLGTYKLIAGRLSLDFVNTVRWPDSTRRHDWLGSVDDVELWLKAVGLPAADCKKADLVSIAALRSTLTAVLRPLAHGKRPAREAINRLNDCIPVCNSRRAIAPLTLAWTWKPPRNSVDAFAPAVIDAADLISDSKRDRLRFCPACDWLFEDQSRNGKRRWCDMADCGSRDKSNRYYHRNN
jgi:predicted RNA-binding Zn ribbon-like protein